MDGKHPDLSPTFQCIAQWMLPTSSIKATPGACFPAKQDHKAFCKTPEAFCKHHPIHTGHSAFSPTQTISACHLIATQSTTPVSARHLLGAQSSTPFFACHIIDTQSGTFPALPSSYLQLQLLALET
eukprot:1159319-Pelagomonas_calceolata.AAC.2